MIKNETFVKLKKHSSKSRDEDCMITQWCQAKISLLGQQVDNFSVHIIEKISIMKGDKK